MSSINTNEVNRYLKGLEIWCSEIVHYLMNRGEEIPKHQMELLEKRVNALSNVIIKSSPIVSREWLEMVIRESRMIEETLQLIYDSQHMNQGEEMVPIGGHVLPPLPYPYAALEPYISEEIMRTHHLVHHKGYVDGLNKAELELKKCRENGDFQLIKHWQRELSFHGSGHYLHAIFWKGMKAKGGGMPTGEFLKAIECAFGSFEKFRTQFTETALKVEGVGWAILAWSPMAKRLEIVHTEKQQLFTQWTVFPILALDVWEHAYYLQYKADRKKYVESWWSLVNWEYVEDQFTQLKVL